MKIFDTYLEREIEYETVLDILDANNIFSVEKKGDKFIFTERCDEWFYIQLTKEHVLALANELISLANKEVLYDDNK